jgi:hypothetical protein
MPCNAEGRYARSFPWNLFSPLFPSVGRVAPEFKGIVHRKPLDELKPISAKILLACERLPFLRER